MKVQEEQYGRFDLRAGVLNGKPTARAFSGRRVVAEVTGDSVEDALTQVKAAIDRQEVEARAARRDGVPTAEEYVQAFERIHQRIGHHHWLMLRAHYHAPDRTMSAGGLARAAGYRSYSSANEKYGLLGKMLADELSVTPPLTYEKTKLPVWTSTLAEEGPLNDDGRMTWRMRPEVAGALERLNAV